MVIVRYVRSRDVRRSPASQAPETWAHGRRINLDLRSENSVIIGRGVIAPESHSATAPVCAHLGPANWTTERLAASSRKCWSVPEILVEVDMTHLDETASARFERQPS